MILLVFNQSDLLAKTTCCIIVVRNETDYFHGNQASCFWSGDWFQTVGFLPAARAGVETDSSILDCGFSLKYYLNTRTVTVMPYFKLLSH